MRLRLLCLVLLLSGTVGCRGGGVSRESSYTLEGTQVRSMTISAPASNQKATVQVTSDVPVNVWVAASKDLPGDIDKLSEMILAGKKPANALAQAEKVTDKTLEARVPAKTEYQVVVYNPNAKSAMVKVKVEGR